MRLSRVSSSLKIEIVRNSSLKLFRAFENSTIRLCMSRNDPVRVSEKRFHHTTLHGPRQQEKGMDEVSVFPRRKAGDGQSAKRTGFRKPLTLRLEQLEPLYCKPQSIAAKELGVSVTTLKQVCRSLGLDHWPFCR